MLIDLPFDLLAIIVTLAITSDINIDNYKTIPHIINAHPNFRKALHYLNNDQWGDICKSIINDPYEPVLGNWHNTFINLPNNITLRLCTLASQGNYVAIRNMKQEIKDRYSNCPIPTRVIECTFKCESDIDLLQILREILIYRIEPSIYKYIPMREYPGHNGRQIFHEYAKYINQYES
jgi:hypothetical protein